MLKTLKLQRSLLLVMTMMMSYCSTAPVEYFGGSSATDEIAPWLLSRVAHRRYTKVRL